MSNLVSGLSEQDQSTPRDPSNYAPRWLRERQEQRSTLAGEPRAEREPRRPPPGRAIAYGPSLDQQLENAVFESLRHPLDPEIMPEPPGFVDGVARRLMGGSFGRLALAVGVAAIAALLIAMMLPSVRQLNVNSWFATTLENSTAAASHSDRAEGGSKPALAEFRTLLSMPDRASQSSAPHQSGQLLRQFLVWREQANLNDPTL